MAVGYAGVSAVQATISGSLNTTTIFPTTGTGQTAWNYATVKAGTSITAGTGVTLKASAGYLSAINVSAAGGPNWELRDGGSGGTLLYSASVGASVIGQHTFPVPIKFATSLWLDVSATQTCFVGASGFVQA